jgi:hypothetical protein
MELAKAAYAGFTYGPSSGGQKRMHWKMSIDLSYPLVPSMGHHDPLDGFITYNQLQATAAKEPEKSKGLGLGAEITDLADICKGKSWVTDDPLGIGGLLSDAYRVAQLIADKYFEQTGLLEVLLDSSLPGLESFAGKNPLKLPADYRLAFRELGLSIGLHAVERLQGLIEEKSGLFDKKPRLDSRIESLMKYQSCSEAIERFWLEKANQEASSWIEHRDINMVMLATSLAPEGYLSL